MNSPFTMVFLIVVVVILADLVKSWLKRDGRTNGADEEVVEETMSRLDLLEERIQVLERIVTENRYDLKKQIDSL